MIPFLGLLFCLSAFRVDAPVERFEYRKQVMGTEARMVLYAAGEAAARAAATAAFARMDALDAILSDYRPDSELTRLSEAAGSGPVPVSADLFRVLARAEELAEASGGAFDVTVGPVVRLWREARSTARPPDPEALCAAIAMVGWRRLRLDAATSTVALDLPGMRLDVGAIGKGYACDRALEVLAASGVASALVDIGGDVAVSDPPPGKAGWVISAGADRPRLLLERSAVATSGATEQFFELDGVRFSHIVDPRTGRGLTDSVEVTVVATDCATADALASAASVLGRHAGRRLVSAAGGRVDFHDPRFTSLFDGRSLAGWVDRGGRYDGAAAWTVEDGAITGRTGENGAGGLLYTARPYTSFVLELETRIDFPFDSGVFLRMAPAGKGAQVTLDHRPGGEIGAVYSDGYLQHNESGKELFSSDAWNHLEVRSTGFDMHIEVWLNGAELIDYQLPAGSKGYAPTGLIGVQVHGSRDDPADNRAMFRNVRVRELPIFGDEPSGFAPLLNGRDLTGWQVVDREDGYRVRDGVLEFLNNGGGGHLQTAADFRDFRLSLDFQLARMANSGVFLRAARGAGNPAFSGCEVQILDDFNWEAVTGTKLRDWQFCGSLYGSVPPGVRALRAIGEWNTYEILYHGSRLAVALNGVPLYDVDTLAVPADPPFSGRAEEGFIGLQRYGNPDVSGDWSVRFRNIRAQPIP